MQSTSQSGPSVNNSNHALYLQKLRESSEAVNSGDFRRAVQLYSDAIKLDPSNPILFTNRSTAYAKLQQYQKSLEDARKAKEINPKWAKVRTTSLLKMTVFSLHHWLCPLITNSILPSIYRLNFVLDQVDIYCL